MSSFLIMCSTALVGVFLAIPTFGLSLLLPIWAWTRVAKKEAALYQRRKLEQSKAQPPAPEPESQRSWFFGFFWW